MSRYDALTTCLLSRAEPVVALTFDELDTIVGGLPNSAKTYGAWWANNRMRGHGWMQTAVHRPTFARRERYLPWIRQARRRMRLRVYWATVKRFSRRSNKWPRRRSKRCQRRCHFGHL